jgi:hypothetical protein
LSHFPAVLPSLLPLLPFAHEEKKHQLPSNGRKIAKRQPQAAVYFSLSTQHSLLRTIFQLPPFPQKTYHGGGGSSYAQGS